MGDGVQTVRGTRSANNATAINSSRESKLDWSGAEPSRAERLFVQSTHEEVHSVLRAVPCLRWGRITLYNHLKVHNANYDEQKKCNT